jgi:hypothetical protein
MNQINRELMRLQSWKRRSEIGNSRPWPPASRSATLAAAGGHDDALDEDIEVASRAEFEGYSFQFALDSGALQVAQHSAEQRNRRTQPSQPNPGLVHAPRIPVPG